MTTVKIIIKNYQKQNQLKPQNHNHKLSLSDSSSSTSLSNSNNPSKKSNSNINIINQIYPASLISTSVLNWNETQDIPIEDGHWIPPCKSALNQFLNLEDIDHLDSEDPSSPYYCSSTPPNQSINRLIEIRDQRIDHLETKICSIKSDLQNFAARLNSSSASSLLTSSNPTSPSIFESQLASSNPGYGRYLREQTFSPINTIHSIAYFICYYYTSFVSDQTTSTPTLKDSSRTTTKSSTTASNLSKDDDQSNPCKSLKLFWRIHVTRSCRLPLKSTKSRNITKTMCS
ncbi:hypothetical protein BY996DRAFT_8435389 [Phakopsora pachyrhizi]|nr:hypothetical protein BY996DRAFT_8435389 [Phakopsora pachyrhizi]